MRRLLPLLLTLLLTLQTFAQSSSQNSDDMEIAVLNQNYIAHSTENFSSRKNVLAIVPEGTKLEILDRKVTPDQKNHTNKNYHLLVRIISVGTSIPTKLTPESKPFWIYYDCEKNLRVVDLHNKKHQPVDDPKEAADGTANRNFGIGQLQPADENAGAKNSANCVKCAERASASATSQPAAESLKQPLAAIQNSAANSVEIVTPAERDLTSDLQRIGHHTSKSQLNTDQRIAKDVIHDCGTDYPNVLIPLLLSMMKKESEYQANVHNSRMGAIGLMQITPVTAKFYHCGDIRNVEANISCGVKIIKTLLTKYSGNVTSVLEAYNAGTGREDAIAHGIKSIPGQTKDYIKTVEGTLNEYYALMKETSLSYVASTHSQ